MVLTLPLLAGCATVIDGSTQSLTVNTELKGASVSDARCKLRNSMGSWVVQTPGTATVQRANDDLLATCEKQPAQSGETYFKSSFNQNVVWNILWLPGVLVDVVTGAGYEYPSNVTVDMKKGK